MVIDLAMIHAYELARANLLGERPLPPARLLELSEHIEQLSADEAWIDKLVAQADAADGDSVPGPDRGSPSS